MHHLNVGKDKWYSVTEYIDEETGEILPKWLVDQEYIIKKQTVTKFITEHENHKTITRRYRCERDRQQRLF